MSNQGLGKKECESIDLDYFFEAYQIAFGSSLELLQKGERPDFLCKRSSGKNIGIELTKIMRSPSDALADKILLHKESMEAYTAFDKIGQCLEIKSQKVKDYHGYGQIDFMLVLQLMDVSLDEISFILKDTPREDYATSGFSEIWLADYTNIDAYGGVNLFGLCPETLWGYRPKASMSKKPYG